MMKRLFFCLVLNGVCLAYPVPNDDNERILFPGMDKVTIGLRRRSEKVEDTNTQFNEKDNSTKTYKGDVDDVEGWIAKNRNKTIPNISRVEDRSSKSLTPSSVLGFMKKFGYLAAGAPNTEALHSEEAIVRAVSEMQRFGGLYPSGVIDEATLELLQKPRCGNHDTTKKHANRRAKRYILGAEGWRKRTMSYHLANWSHKLWNQTFVQGELDRAFAAWAGYANLKFVKSDDYHTADIVVSFGRYGHGDSFPFDGPGLVLAHAYYPYEFGHFGGDIHFDEDEDWRPDVKDMYSGMDFFTVAVHEIGHSLGLSHSPVADSVMYPYYKGKQTSFSLGYDDILAMYELYITRDIADDEEESSKNADEDYVVSKIPDDKDSNKTDYEDYLADEGDYYNSSDEETTTTTKKSITTTTITTTPSIPTSRTPISSTTPFPPTTESNEKDNSTQTYEGDVEDVDGWIEKTQNKTIPDLCSGQLDAIGHLRGELFMFLGQSMWRFLDRGNLRNDYPADIQQMFQFPQHVSKIDAVYERSTDGSIIFFSGNKYWINNGNQFIDGSPRPLTDFGLPSDLTRIDAAFVWGKNKKTYIFAGDLYWRFDEKEGSLESGYPKNMKNWRGVPVNLDGVLTWKDGLTYFFKQGKYWRFDDYMVITDTEIPLPMPQYWAGC